MPGLTFRALLQKMLLPVVIGLAMTGSPRAETGVSDGQIIIGQSITLQGGANAYGSAASFGSKLYIDRANAAGGVHDRRIVLRILDDDNSSSTAEANARKLVADGAFLLFGSVEGGPSVAVMKVAEALKVPFFGPMAGSPALRSPPQPLVFPVRAEHKEEFRALMLWGKRTGLASVGFMFSDSEVGQSHLANVNRLTDELGMQLALTLPLDADVSDAEIDAMVQKIAEARPDMIFNHGSAGVYQRLITKARAAGLSTHFMAVNSGSSQLAQALGPLAHGMVFAQVVPNPNDRKYPIVREFQDALEKAGRSEELSYGALEGFMTAKAMVMALDAAGPALTRNGFVSRLEASRFDLGGVSVRYAPADHEGSRFVDLSIVARDGRFVQ